MAERTQTKRRRLSGRRAKSVLCLLPASGQSGYVTGQTLGVDGGWTAEWHVEESDTFFSGDGLAELETDKVTVEVQAIDEGLMDAILVPKPWKA